MLFEARQRHSHKQQALFLCPLFSCSYGGPCEAGFGLAGSLGRRFPTLVRSATQTRRKVGWRLLNQFEEHKENALSTFYPRAPPWAVRLVVYLQPGGAP